MRFTQHGCLNLEQDIRVLVTKLSDLFPDVPVSFLFWKKQSQFSYRVPFGGTGEDGTLGKGSQPSIW